MQQPINPLFDEIETLASIAKLRVDQRYHEACLANALSAVLEGNEDFAKRGQHHQDELAKIEEALEALDVVTRRAAKPKAAKIYIRAGDNLHSFMWANVGPDGSVMLGFTFAGNEEVELVLDDKMGELRRPHILTLENVGQSKISFHSSGQYKLSSQMGKATDSVDRATVEGPKLADITEPRRMVELLLPKSLPKTSKSPGELDIVLDATSAPEMPLRCTISCMRKDYFEKAIKNDEKFVDTSVWEYVHALEYENQVWVWTLRASRNDEAYLDRIGIFLIGPVKWGQATKRAR